ncbi:MAG TPA: hypothetical protein VJQ77_00450 [Novosphingobium sp.]|nr:hypothetical protein [Novosphingobium sp.]
MKRMVWVSAAALAAVVACGPALADDPNEKLTPEELAQDRETIRRLNREQLDYVRKRDARYADGWRAYARSRRGSGSGGRYEAQQQVYEADRRDYERAMAEWRHDVAACRAGYYEYCRR